MSKKVQLIIIIICFFIFIAISIILYNNIINNTDIYNDAYNSKKLTPAKDFTVYDINNKPVKLSELRDKPIVINFWATWCGYCLEEMPYFNSAYIKEMDNVHFMMINATDGIRETVDIANNFIQKKNYKFDVYFDLDLSTVNSYEIYGYPVTIFIDKQGNIVKTHKGMISEETLLNNIKIIKQSNI